MHKVVAQKEAMLPQIPWHRREHRCTWVTLIYRILLLHMGALMAAPKNPARTQTNILFIYQITK